MASDQFEDIFERASHDLSPAEQLKLIEELSKLARSNSGNGATRDKSLYDALNVDGIIGSITDAPPDLGINPTYMEGFGQHAP